jgi:hypothetical protein
MHGQKGCHQEGSRRSPGTEEDQPYSPWLRVIFLLRRLVPRPGRDSLGKADGRLRKSFPTPEYYAERRYTEEEPKGSGAATHRGRKPISRTELANMETTGNGNGEVNGEINGEDCFQTGNVESPTNLIPLRRDMWGLNPLGDCDAESPSMKKDYKKGIKYYVGKEDRWGDLIDLSQDSQCSYGNNILQMGQSSKSIPEDLAKAKSGILPQKFVGQFDPGLNKMVWRCFKVDKVINLEKDPIHDTYFPLVEAGARRITVQDTEIFSSHSGLSFGPTNKSVYKLKVPESTFQ